MGTEARTKRQTNQTIWAALMEKFSIVLDTDYTSNIPVNTLLQRVTRASSRWTRSCDADPDFNGGHLGRSSCSLRVRSHVWQCQIQVIDCFTKRCTTTPLHKSIPSVADPFFPLRASGIKGLYVNCLPIQRIKSWNSHYTEAAGLKRVL